MTSQSKGMAMTQVQSFNETRQSTQLMDAHSALLSRLQADPNDKQALWQLAQWCWQQQELGSALACVSKVISANPYDTDAVMLRAHISQQLQDWPAVANDLARCEVAQPRSGPLALWLATNHLTLRQMDKAEPYFERALALSDLDAVQQRKVQWEFAMQLLMMEDFERGWAYHEARFDVFGAQALHVLDLPDPRLPIPRWKGQPLAGQRILVHGEQGIGDEVMAAGLIPDLIAQGADVTLACHPSLLDLFAASFDQVSLIAHPRGQPADWVQALPAAIVAAHQTKPFDFQISSLSLAKHLRMAASDFPQQAYLKVDAARQQRMAQVLTTETDRQLGQGAAQAGATHQGIQRRPLRIGLAWCGNLQNTTAALRSVPLATLLPLRDAAPDAIFVSLQSPQYAAQQDEHPQMRLVNMSEHTSNFADLAALMQQLDLVISVDTSYVHIAGGLGCKTWLMQSYRGEWRWGWARQQALWYPDVRIWRQPQVGDWSSVVADMAQKLVAMGHE